MMELMKSILLFFASIRNSFLNILFEGITMFGEEELLIVMITFIYWNISKRRGYAICLSLMSSASIMGVLKAIVRFPRPWVLIEGFEPLRQGTATGYSFPSGHTTNATSAFTSFALLFKKRWVKIFSIIMIVLVPISRLYLGVHWPTDVIAGTIIGVGCSLFILDRFLRKYDNKPGSIKDAAIFGAIAFAVMVVLSILLMLGKVDATAFEDLNLTFAMLSGVLGGYAMERSTTNFRIKKGHWKLKILRYIIGISTTALFLFGLKPLLSVLGIYNSLTRGLRYFITGFWAVGLFPMIGVKLKLFSN